MTQKPTSKELAAIIAVKAERARLETGLLWQIFDGIRRSAQERGVWPSDGLEYPLEGTGRFVTATDLLTTARSLAYRSGLRIPAPATDDQANGGDS